MSLRSFSGGLPCLLAVLSTWLGGSANAEPLSLEQALARAQAASPQLLAAQSLIERARAVGVAARVAVPDNPELALELGPRWSSDGLAPDLEASISQAIFVSGQRGRRAAQAAQSVVRAEAAYAVTRAELLAAVREAYLDALYARDALTLAQELAASQARLEALVAANVRAGERAPLDGDLAALERLAAERDVQIAQENEQRSRIALGALIGWDVRETPPEPTDLTHDLTVPPLAALLTFAEQHAPTSALADADRALAASHLRVAQAEAGITPSVGLAFGYEGGLGAEPSISSLRATFSVPLPFAQRNQGPIAEARAELRSAEALQAASRAALLAELAQAHAALERARKTRGLMEASVLPTLKTALTRMERAVALGEIALSEAIIIRDKLTSAQKSLLEARSQEFSAFTKIERLLGVPPSEVTP